MEREEERVWFVVPLIHAFIGCFLYVPWPEMEPATAAYQTMLQPTELQGQGKECFLRPGQGMLFEVSSDGQIFTVVTMRASMGQRESMFPILMEFMAQGNEELKKRPKHILWYKNRRHLIKNWLMAKEKKKAAQWQHQAKMIILALCFCSPMCDYYPLMCVKENTFTPWILLYTIPPFRGHLIQQLLNSPAPNQNLPLNFSNTVKHPS